MSDIIFKTILLKGEAGNNIGTIAKTSTEGVVDTYTITLTDGSTSTFQVTNGSNISSIEKTATAGLVDTYTITLTNGDTFNFEVVNGADGANINLAPTERGDTASRSYGVGEHLLLNGNYYVVTQTIAQNDTLEVNTNIESALVGEEITQLTSDLTANNKKYQADYQNGKYGFVIDNEFHPFSQGTVYLGEYSANTAINVSDLGATSADQFLVVPSSKGGSVQTYQDYGAGGSLYCYVSCAYTTASITLTNGVLSITAPSISGSASHADASGASRGYATSASAIPTYKVYYIGDVETSS